MEELFMWTDVVDLLSSLPKRSPTEQIQCWKVQKEQHRRTSSLLRSLGRQITAAQAKRLDALNLSYEVLREIRQCYSGEEFVKTLLERGVRSKVLREKLKTVLDRRIK